MPPYRSLMLVALLLIGRAAMGIELGAEGEPLSVEIHGFASQGFIVSTENNYLAKSKDGSFEFSEVGINFTKVLTDNLRIGLQLFAQKLGPTGDFNAKFDWFYLDYRWTNWLGFRAGRVKLPFGLYNDINDIDAARVSVLLPQSVYPISNRNFLLAQTGGELYGYVDLRKVGALDYHLYGGTIFLPIPSQPSSPITVTATDVPYIVGGRLMWETPVEGLRAGSSLQVLRLDADVLYSLPVPTAVTIKIPAVLWVNSIEYTHRDLVLAAEYSRWYIRGLSSNPALFPESSTVVHERAYALATYRVKPWLHPGLYYSLFYPNTEKRAGRENMQHDLAATLRFDINPYWLVKLEGHYMIGTADLASSLNNNNPLSALAQDWWVFLVKTTGYF